MRMHSIIAAAASLLASTAAYAIPTVSSDPVLFWNEQALELVPSGVPGPPGQTRAYAMLNVAMYGAVNAALGSPYRTYTSGVTATGGNPRAAASQAAHDVLVAINPANAAAYDTALAASLALVPNGPGKARGIATGAAYAAAVRNSRSADGSAAVVTYTSTGAPGDWRPTTPGNPAVPQWGDVTPFVLASGDQFRPGLPFGKASVAELLASPEYAAAYNEVKAIGAAVGSTRTSDQTNAALFWDAANGGTWLRIGVTVAEDETRSTLEFARGFALLTTGVADALIAGFDSKYEYRLWRPKTAINLGDTDFNADTAGDAAWNSLFNAPLHPSYISTHSALSGVGATILADLFGDDQAFTFTIAGDTRSFTGLEQAAEDGANSRLWGGIHFSFDNVAGLTLGRQIGGYALASGAFDPVPEPGMTLAFGGLPLGLLAGRRRRL